MMLIYETQLGLIRQRNQADAAFRAAHPDDPRNVAKGRDGWYQGGYGAAAGQMARDRKDEFSRECGCRACQLWQEAWIGDGQVLMGCDAREHLGGRIYDRLHAALS